MTPGVEKIALGTVQFGLAYGISNLTGKPSKAEVYRILDLAAKAGIATLDTADVYGDSQQLIGGYGLQASTQGLPFRILTKFVLAGGSDDIVPCLEASLSQLRLPKVRCYSFHKFSDFLAVRSSTRLEQLRDSALTEKIGVSIYTDEEFSLALNDPRIDVIQTPFNLFDNYNLRGRFIREAKDRGKEVHVRSVFLQGLFFKDQGSLPSKLGALAPLITRLHSIADRSCLSVHSLALLYALSFPEIDQVIIGVNSHDELAKNLDVLNLEIPDAAFDEIHSLKIETRGLLNPSLWS